MDISFPRSRGTYMDQERKKTTPGAPGTGEPKKLSGAARRKQKKMRQEPGGPKQPELPSSEVGQPGGAKQPGKSSNKAALRAGTQKRHRSDGSTPKGGYFEEGKNWDRKGYQNLQRSSDRLQNGFCP